MTRAVKLSSNTGPPETFSSVWFIAKTKFNGAVCNGSGTSRNTARFTMLLIFFGYVSPCTTPDLAAGCPIQAFVMNRRLMGQKGKEEKEKEKKLRKKNIVQIQFWNIYSTAYKGGIFEKYKKEKRRDKRHDNSKSLKTISISVDSPLTNLLPFSLFTIMPQYA